MASLIGLFRVLRDRIPSRYLPTQDLEDSVCTLSLLCKRLPCFSGSACLLRRNLRQLVDISGTWPCNYPKGFWRWLHKQPWRKMLPLPVEHPGWKTVCYGLFDTGTCIAEMLCWLDLRVDVLLTDMSAEVPVSLGSWHLFLVSDVFLCCVNKQCKMFEKRCGATTL